MADGNPIRIGQTNNIESNTQGTGTVLGRAANSPRTDPVFTVRTPVGGDGIHGEASGNRTGVQGTSASGTGVHGESASGGFAGVFGRGTSGVGVRGNSDSGIGVVGSSISDTGVFGGGNNIGVSGSSSNLAVFGNSDSGFGMFGRSTSSVGAGGQSNSNTGVQGVSTSGLGVGGFSTSFFGTFGSSTNSHGVRGFSTNSVGVSGGGTTGVDGIGRNIGVRGESTSGSGVLGEGSNIGVRGFSTDNFGVLGQGLEAGVKGEGGFFGVHGEGSGIIGVGVRAEATGGNIGLLASSSNMAIRAISPRGTAGEFQGNVSVVGGNLDVSGSITSNGTKPFKIDHPLDPQNKYLLHTAVESPEMKNVYDSVAQLDEEGAAWVELPEWFEALNGDFRYQLTAVGGSAPNLHVAEEISENRFKIAGGEENAKVCWQVTGTRKDPWAAANPFEVEQEKPEENRGRYVHPALYGAPEEQRVMMGPRIPEAVEEEQRPPQPAGIDFARREEEGLQQRIMQQPPPPPQPSMMPPSVDFVRPEEEHRGQIDELRRLVEKQRREIEELRRRVGPQEEAPPETT